MGLEQQPPTPAPARPERLVSVDAYRGFVMLAMISAGLGMSKLMKDPTWGWLARQLEHKPWEGCTFWDLIQPSFMFIVGVAMPFSFAVRQARGEGWGHQFLHAVRRSLTLIAIGIFLDSYHSRPPGVTVEFIRVLQQIAIGYLIAFLVLHLGPRIQAATAGLLLLLHTGAFLLYAHNTELASAWGKWANFGDALDAWLYLPFNRGGYATFNAVSSAATILFGVLAGELLRSATPPLRKLLLLTVAGFGGLAAGAALTPMVPMVKRLWTSSFALYAAGWTCLMLAAFYGVIDVLGYRRWTFPLVVVGMNSIAAYVAAGVLTGPFRQAIRPFLNSSLERLPAGWHLQEAWYPVVLSVLVTLGLWLFCYWLYRHRIFFKV
jgi:predicted acyltransferase